VDVPCEKGSADFLFELLDALADRGLRAADALRRTRERSLLNDGEKVLELEEIQVAVSFS
jgi:hypothetical protein